MDCVGLGGLDGYDRLVLCLPDSDSLLWGRCQLFVGLRLCAEALDSVHHICVLRHNRIAEFLGPVELVTHHRQHVRYCYQ